MRAESAAIPVMSRVIAEERVATLVLRCWMVVSLCVAPAAAQGLHLYYDGGNGPEYPLLSTCGGTRAYTIDRLPGSPVGPPPYVVGWRGSGVAGTRSGISQLPYLRGVPTPVDNGQPLIAEVIDRNGRSWTVSYGPPGGPPVGWDRSPGDTVARVSGNQCIRPGQLALIDVELDRGAFNGSSTSPAYSWTLNWSDGWTYVVSWPTQPFVHQRLANPSQTTTYTLTSVTAGPQTCRPRSVGSATVAVRSTGSTWSTAGARIIRGGQPLCPGESGDIDVELSSFAPYSPITWTIHWSDGLREVVESPTQPYIHTRTVTPSASTTYSIISVGDSCGAETSGQGSAPFTVFSDPPLVVTSASLSNGVITVNGSGFQAGIPAPILVRLHQELLPTTVVSPNQLTATAPALSAVTGAPLYVERFNLLTGCATETSNAVALTWGVGRDNRGTVINVVRGGGGAPFTMTLRVEGGVPLQPLSLVADPGAPLGTFPTPIAVLGNSVLSTFSANVVPLLDGLGVLSFWGPAPPAQLDADGMAEFSVTVPPGVSGVPLRVQGLYADSSAPGLVRLTWPLEAFIP